MKKFLNTILSIMVMLLILNCSELTGGDDDDNTAELAAAALLLNSGAGGTCSTETLSSSYSTSRTKYNVSGCDSSGLSGLGFPSSNISSGLKASSTEGTMGSNGDLGESSKVNVEITYKIDSSDGYIDVIGLASVSGSNPTGPGIRLQSGSAQTLTADGTAANFATGTAPSSTVGTQKTVCLEIHSEGGGAHIFGWDSNCDTASSAGSLGSYTFESEDVATTINGQRVGFKMKNATMTSFTISNAIGTAGSIRE